MQWELRRRCRRAFSAAPISASSSRAGRRTSSCSTNASKSCACSAEARLVSWLENELREQPAALERLLQRQGERAREIAGIFGRDDVQYVLIASRGSSSNVARYAQYLLGRAHRVPVMFATPSLYTIYEQPPRLTGAVVVGISQSGASPGVAPALEEYADSVGATVVARGVNYGTAFEIALKIRELSGLVVEAYSPADLMHGPIAAIRPGWPVIVVAPTGPARPSVESLVLPLLDRGARIIAVSDVAAVLRRAQTRLPPVRCVPSAFRWLVLILFGPLGVRGPAWGCRVPPPDRAPRT